MYRFFYFIVIFLFSAINYANIVIENQIKLPDHFKILNTFSGNLSDTESFHLILTKNSQNKKYTLHPYIFDNKSIKELKIIENDYKYTLVSFHKEKGVLSLLLKYLAKATKRLEKINIDYINNEISKEGRIVVHENYKTHFSEENRSVYIYKYFEKVLVKQYIGPKKTITSRYFFKKKKDHFKKTLKKQNIIPIKTNEFVKNGSYFGFEAYLTKEHIYFTKKNVPKSSTEIFSMRINDTIMKLSELKTFKISNEPKLYKKYTSYLQDGKLYQLALNKEKGSIIVNNIKTDKVLNIININSSLASKIKSSNSFIGIEKFLENANKNAFNPTITVNKTIDNKYIVRIDYVDITYNYYNNHHFWHLNNHMQMHNEFTLPSSRFGPSVPNEYAFENATVNKENRYFELLLNEKGEVLNEDLPKTVYKKIDRQKYIDHLKEQKNTKFKSSCFLKDRFIYIDYSKDSKEFTIHTKNYNDTI